MLMIRPPQLSSLLTDNKNERGCVPQRARRRGHLRGEQSSPATFTASFLKCVETPTQARSAHARLKSTDRLSAHNLAQDPCVFACDDVWSSGQ
jgi:hypothetical protein